MRRSEPRLLAARQAAAWNVLRPCGEDLRDLADYVLEVTPGSDAALARVVHELAVSSRHASMATALNEMIRGHIRRALCGAPGLQPLGGKTLAFHRCFSERAAWQWLACR